jgi:hypothetical protein
MLSVIMLSVIMLSFVMLSVVMLSFVMLSVTTLGGIILSVDMMSVVMPVQYIRTMMGKLKLRRLNLGRVFNSRRFMLRTYHGSTCGQFVEHLSRT